MPLSPVLLVAAANAMVGFDGAGGRYPLGALFLHEVCAGLSGEQRIAWDAAFVHHLGWWTHYDTRGETSSWPFEPSASVEAIAAFAAKHGAIRTEPVVGDLFLLKSPRREQFVRTGIVVRAGRVHTDEQGRAYRNCGTIEGDSDERLAGDGGWILRHERRFIEECGDRFVRWTALDRRSLNARDVQRRIDTVWLKTG